MPESGQALNAAFSLFMAAVNDPSVRNKGATAQNNTEKVILFHDYVEQVSKEFRGASPAAILNVLSPALKSEILHYLDLDSHKK